MNLIAKYISFFLDLPKTLIFNIKYFGIKGALTLPVKVSRKVKFINLKGNVTLNGDKHRGVIELGYSDVGIVDKRYNRTIWDVSGNVVFNGKAKIGYGSKISVGNKGNLTLGNEFVITASSSIVCFNKISFGDGCLLSWDILVIDTDFHKIIIDDIHPYSNTGEINIGSKNWIGCRCIILKGAKTYDNCVIGAGSLLNRDYETSNALIAGNPSKRIKEIKGWVK